MLFSAAMTLAVSLLWLFGAGWSDETAVLTRGNAAPTPLAAGQTIHTAAKELARLEVPGAFQIWIGPNSEARLASLERQRLSGTFRAQLLLIAGRTLCRSEGKTSLEIESPVGRATVENGAVEVALVDHAMRVTAWKGGATYVSQFQRTVQYALSEGEVVVADGDRAEHQIHRADATRLDDFQRALLR